MRAVIYARYSTDMQSAASVEDQVHACTSFIERQGWTSGETFSDRAQSGASMLRPGLQDLISHVTDGACDVVVAEALDRLSRDQADIAALYKRLRFADVVLVTLTEGEISELHVGLKGTMNQLFLKDLAVKTRRGLEGRVRKGRSAGGLCYGYAVIPGDEGDRGAREIVQDEAVVVRRIFEDFAAGKSPKAIARALNDEGVPGPRGILWRDTAIRGHRKRGTGLLNNELYIGRLVWNRLRYVKDPETGRRVSRINPKESWISEEVPHLRIVSDDLWSQVKARQEEIDATPAVKAIKESRFWERRRPRHFLSGLLDCGSCGGGIATMGKTYVACSNARKLGTCDSRKGIRRDRLEALILDLLKERLLEPEPTSVFVSAYNASLRDHEAKADDDRRASQAELDKVTRQLEGLYDAIGDGLRTDGLLGRVRDLEARQAELRDEIETPDQPPVRLHPRLGDLYRAAVADLATRLTDPAIREEASALLRRLIDKVVVHQGDAGQEIELHGSILSLVNLANPAEVTERSLSSAKVVAGAGYHRYRHSLEVAI